MKKLAAVILFVLVCFSLLAQKRIRPGQSLNAGDTVVAPGVGITFMIPEGWSGLLPHQGEIAFLVSEEHKSGYIFLMARETENIDTRSALSDPLKLTDEIIIVPKGEPEINGNFVVGNYQVSGLKRPFVAYVKARKGQFGVAAIYILITPEQYLSKEQPLVDQMISQTLFSEPINVGLYGDFEWSEKLKDKYLVQYDAMKGYRVKAEIWLCADGSFTTRFKEGGPLKGVKKPYRGKNTGIWTAKGIGPNGILRLAFAKKEPLELEMKIDDEKVYINQYRFYFLIDDSCY